LTRFREDWQKTETKKLEFDNVVMSSRVPLPFYYPETITFDY
jgi:hypothetical protein